MKELLNNYNCKKEIKLKDLAELHAKYELIHPFQDGNGRTDGLFSIKNALKMILFPLLLKMIEKKNTMTI